MSNSTNPTPQDHPPTPTPIPTASYPFNKANADIILRTSDRVDFHVYSQILVAASPFFEGMFDVPQPPLDQQELKYGRPIIDVSETSKALDTLLRICYPINKPDSRSLEEIELALAAAIKFEMELPKTMLIAELKSKTLTRRHPLEVWGIACRLGLEGVARCAAKEVASSPDFKVLGDMDGIMAGDYFRLREYLRLRRQVPSAFEFLSPSTSPWTNLRAGRFPAITSQSLADAPPPDIICRSVDGVEFRAHKTVVSLASATLREKLNSTSSSPREEGSTIDVVLPTFQFEEGSIVLLAMLQLSYHAPADVTLPTGLGDLTAVLLAVEKYKLDAAQPAVWSFWHVIASTQPLQAYCYAIRAGHVACAKEAARCVLNQTVEGVYAEELESTPALAYHRLLVYYEKCCSVAKTEFGKIDDALKTPLSLSPIVAPQASAAPSQTPPPRAHGANVPSRWSTDFGSLLSCQSNSSWIQGYVRDLSSRFQVRPGSDAPALSKLFADATKASNEDTGPRVWCKECQVVADQILEVDKALRRLPDGLGKVELEI
uniref:Extracellular lipase (EC) n=1 Tax=Ganoderma boninense TaxID=34458 RepID=A0A5K1K7A8_9APHY|nr:Extracellular lipase (EC [Ganoderma boninense]